MDTVTHGLTGWLIGRALHTEEGRKAATAAVVAGSVLPDADNISSLFGNGVHLVIHRGFSHAFAGVAVTSLLAALLFHRFGKWKDLKKLYLLVLLGQISHIVLDLLNSYGTQIFQPFSDARFSLDILFVVDLVFTGIIVAGLCLSRRRPGPARAAMAVLAAYVAFATVLHLRVESLVRSAARQYGVPVVSASALPRLPEMEVGPDLANLNPVGVAWARPEARGIASLPIAPGARRIPVPAGPFGWNGFVDDGRTYLRADVHPFSGDLEWKERVPRGRDQAKRWSIQDLPEIRNYLWFARFPVVQESDDGRRRVLTFSDLRFGGVPGRLRPFVLRVIDAPGRPPQVRWEG